jgi:hypothetical protein
VSSSSRSSGGVMVVDVVVEVSGIDVVVAVEVSGGFKVAVVVVEASRGLMVVDVVVKVSGVMVVDSGGGTMVDVVVEVSRVVVVVVVDVSGVVVEVVVVGVCRGSSSRNSSSGC